MVSNKVEIHRESLFTLVVCALRFSLSKKTAMSGYVCDIIKDYSKFFSTIQLKQIYNEIKNELNELSKKEQEMWKKFLNDKMFEKVRTR